MATPVHHSCVGTAVTERTHSISTELRVHQGFALLLGGVDSISKTS